MSKMKIPKRLLRLFPQNYTNFVGNSGYESPEQTAYILIAILSIINYVNSLLSAIIAVVLYFTLPSLIICAFFELAIVDGFILIIDLYYYIVLEKKDKKQYMHLENDFEVSNNKNKEKNEQEKQN